mmetsp:Transcript_81910/g.219966  ORF Transcript_81910/g.219966 Transcript_81910/m.219966 type:complete len:292 (-) Transcript_81910:19-894(-)
MEGVGMEGGAARLEVGEGLLPVQPGEVAQVRREVRRAHRHAPPREGHGQPVGRDRHAGQDDAAQRVGEFSRARGAVAHDGRHLEPREVLHQELQHLGLEAAQQAVAGARVPQSLAPPLPQVPQRVLVAPHLRHVLEPLPQQLLPPVQAAADQLGHAAVVVARGGVEQRRQEPRVLACELVHELPPGAREEQLPAVQHVLGAVVAPQRVDQVLAPLQPRPAGLGGEEVVAHVAAVDGVEHQQQRVAALPVDPVRRQGHAADVVPVAVHVLQLPVHPLPRRRRRRLLHRSDLS